MASRAEVRVAQETVNDEAVDVVQWIVTDGQEVAEGDVLVKIESSKAMFEIEAPASGFVKILAREEEEVPVGGVLCYVCESLADSQARDETIAGEERDASGVPDVARFSAGALRLLEERGLDRSVFAGVGLVREKDVLRHIGESTGASGADPRGAPAESGAAVAGPVPAIGVPTRRERLKRAKRTEIRYLRSAHDNTLPSSVTVSVPIRGWAGGWLDAPDSRSVFSTAILFEAARLLRKYEAFNALCSAEHVIYYEEINVGYAVDAAGHGLNVPVIRNADEKTLQEILHEKRELLVRYLGDDLPMAALTGGTFTITDLFAEGVTSFAPLLNQGQSAILGIGSPHSLDGGNTGVFNLILVFDHQLATGQEAARFLGELRERLLGHEDSLLRGWSETREEPHCSYCLKPLGELQAMDAFLLKTVSGTDDRSRLVCESCLQGW